MGMNNIQAILSIDIDGTLMDSKEAIHPNDIQLLLDFPRNIQPILATGRELYSTKPIFHANGLFHDSPLPLPGVFMNGGTAYLPNEVLYIHHYFPMSIRDELIALAENNPQTVFIFSTLNVSYVANPNLNLADQDYLIPVQSPAEEVPEEILKVLIIERDRSVLERVVKSAASLQTQMAYSLPFLFEINPPGITKAVTLIKLIEKMGLSSGIPIYAVGDGENDLSLFELSQVSFAPSNAHPSILEKADHVIIREEKGIFHPIFSHLGIG